MIYPLQSNWDRALTASLIEKRRRVIIANIEARIKTAAEREEFARQKIRIELVEKAEAGDWDGIKEMLTMIADEAEATDSKPRFEVVSLTFANYQHAMMSSMLCAEPVSNAETIRACRCLQ